MPEMTASVTFGASSFETRLPVFFRRRKICYVFHSFLLAVPRGTRNNMVWRTLVAAQGCTMRTP